MPEKAKTLSTPSASKKQLTREGNKFIIIQIALMIRVVECEGSQKNLERPAPQPS